MFKVLRWFFAGLWVCVFHPAVFAQTFNDGPIELRVRVREIQVNHNATDFSLGFAPDDFTFKVWARDNSPSAWQGGQCLTSNFNPPGASADFNNVFFTSTFPGTVVPGRFDIRLEAWEDDVDADPLAGACGGSRCTYTASVCCLSLPIIGCTINEGDDNYCDANPYRTGLNYRLGNPCQWYDHGFITGTGCNNGYLPRIESYWRFINGDNFATAIDLGTLTPGGTLIHNNSTECYIHDYGDPGNDVFVRFTIAQGMGVRISLCGGATFNTTLYLLDANGNRLYENLDATQCPPQSEIAENLCTAGTYYVVIDGSTSAERGLFNLTITEDPTQRLTPVITSTNVSCNGVADGSASVAVTGGTTPYQYRWTPGNATVPAISGLAAGRYIVRVTDAQNCIVFDTVDIVEPNTLVINQIRGFDPICNAEPTGEIAIPSVSGGTLPYSYSIGGPFQPSSAFDNLPAGDYSATVRDAQGCTATADVTLTDPPPIQGNLSSTPESCAGFADGSIFATPSMGTDPYYCALNFPPIFTTCTGVYENLRAGTYYVSIRDGNNCEITEAIEVLLIPALNISLVSKDNVRCNGDSDGRIEVSSVGGTPPIRYSIDGGTTYQSSPIFTGLSANLYTVLVSDFHDCQNTLNVQIDEPTPLVPYELFQFSISCNGLEDGLMVVTANGGTSPYRFSLDSVDFYQSGAFNDLAGGSYHFIVVDNNNCVESFDAVLYEPDVLQVTVVSSTNASCTGINNGTLTLGTSGGTPPFKFSINNGPFQSGAAFTGLTAGSYLVGVEDKNACVAYDSVTIGANTSISATVIPTHILCNGDNTGEIEIIDSNGTAPYEYSINNILFQPTGVFTGLIAGSYTAIARDGNGCMYIEPIEIVQPPVLSATIDSIQSATCPGILDGAIYLTPSGGVGNYEFNWSNSFISEDIVNVAGGNYSLTVRDGNACEFTLSAAIPQPNQAFADITRIVNVSCAGDADGYVDLDVVGGVPPFTYRWSDNSTNQDLIDVAGGNYFVTVTDAGGCEAYDTAFVVEPDSIFSSIAATGVSCATSAEADITLTVSGGTPPYSYLWSNFETTKDLVDVSAGTYIVRIEDENECIHTDRITIPTAPGLSATLNITDISCFGRNDGQVEIIVSGGTMPYNYSWSNSQNTAVITNLQPGIYDVTVTDALACTGIFPALVEEPEELKVLTSSTDVLCFGDNNGLAIPFVTGGTGENTFLWSNVPDSANPVQTNLSAGTYVLEVRDENDCLVEDTITIGEPSELHVSIAGTDNVLCLSGTDGEVAVNADGGTPPYRYSVLANRFQDENVFTGLTAGDYGVMVMDENDCFATNSFTLTESAGFEVNLPPYIFIAMGASDTLKPVVLGNDSIASYEWTPSDFLSCTDCPNPEVVLPTYDVSYMLVVRDFDGCIAEDEVTVVIKTEYEVFMPNIFSPNGDGLNDTYFPIDFGAVRTATLKIFNRWGSLLYETRDMNTGWDGRFQGEDVMPGVFIYHITGEFLDGNVFDQTGSVTVVR